MRGLSLVELMVALTLGLLLLAGIFQIYLDNRQSYRTQQGMSLVQEGGRFATLFMSRTIRHAGYLTRFTDRPSDVFDTGTAGPAIEGTENGANPDSVTVRYQGQTDNLMLDCFGQPVAANTVVTNQFSLGPPDADGLRSLRCEVDDGGAQEMVRGIQNMQILYGVDETNNGVRDTSNYVTADNIPDWHAVRSVRLQLTVSDNDEIGDKTFVTTVAIRNRLDDF